MKMQYIKWFLSDMYLFFLRITKRKLTIGRGRYINFRCKFEQHVMILDNCRLFNSTLGSYTYISPGSILINSIIGRFCSIGPGVKIGLGIHPLHLVSTSPYFYDKNLKDSFSNRNYFDHFSNVKIGNDVWIGANVLIMGGLKIGNGAVIAAGSIVTKDVEPYAIVMGAPAKFHRFRLPDDVILKIKDVKWWEWDNKKLKESADLFIDSNLFNNI